MKSLLFVDYIREASLTLSVAETSTGGMIADMITNQPGASAMFMGSIVAYSYPSLEDILKIDLKTLQTHGAVSEATVIEMAQSVRLLFKSDIGIALCGITGPSGGTAQKPVGTTWLAISDGKNTRAATACFEGDRLAIKAQMAQQALQNLQAFLQSFYPLDKLLETTSP
ncbi:MAG: CinA family protein [Chloroflexi bacterium]|nr:CinA family protein [Chloroflexota bacterium]